MAFEIEWLVPVEEKLFQIVVLKEEIKYLFHQSQDTKNDILH